MGRTVNYSVQDERHCVFVQRWCIAHAQVLSIYVNHEVRLGLMVDAPSNHMATLKRSHQSRIADHCEVTTWKLTFSIFLDHHL